MAVSSLTEVERFVETTRDVVFLREVDRILIIRPNKLQHVNDTAFQMLFALYHRKDRPEVVLKEMSSRYGCEEGVLRSDLIRLVDSVEAIMREEYGRATMVETIDFDPSRIKYPVLSEIALTYGCQNRCLFCYASSPYRADPETEMDTEQVKLVIRKIYSEAHVPTISFTGGEPTIRADLPELIQFADKLGMRTNLITNGIRCAEAAYTAKLAESGLKSAQVSLEAHLPEIHDEITGNTGSYQATIEGIRNLKSEGIFTHTNTTICRANREHLVPLVTFVKETFDFPHLSMNMIIRTGIARDNDSVEITYAEVAELLPPVIAHCESIEIRPVWYSPTPYCLFNPVDHNLGSKSCACVSGLLSVSPAGEILPCSSFSRGIGSLLTRSFESVWRSDEALYWRDRRYKPPVCRGCDFEELCGGGCPLYWEHAGSFKEIETVRQCSPKLKNAWWSLERVLRTRSRGTAGLNSARR